MGHTGPKTFTKYYASPLIDSQSLVLGGEQRAELTKPFLQVGSELDKKAPQTLPDEIVFEQNRLLHSRFNH